MSKQTETPQGITRDDSGPLGRGDPGTIDQARLLRAVFDALPVTINCKSADSRYVMMNRFQAEQLGQNPEDVIGKTTEDLFGRDWGNTVREQDLQVIHSGRPLPLYEEDYNALGGRAGHWLTCKAPLRLGPGEDFDHIATFSIDISHLYEQRRQLQSQALTDPMTGLFNRRWMDERLNTLTATAPNCETQTFGLLLIDIDHFKRVNDTWGHDAGDAILKAVARRFKAMVREQDAICRVGGEEFAVLLSPVSPDTTLREKDAWDVGERLRMAISSLPFRIGDRDIDITVSIGCAVWIPPERPIGIYKRADLALYKAKASGRNQVISSIS